MQLPIWSVLHAALSTFALVLLVGMVSCLYACRALKVLHGESGQGKLGRPPVRAGHPHSDEIMAVPLAALHAGRYRTLYDQRARTTVLVCLAGILERCNEQTLPAVRPYTCSMLMALRPHLCTELPAVAQVL
jgi:hypothetical protein